jgi:ectoine hydroxylase-related dioxygenase (phytanoyl-CoA dioxygenase family)
MSPVDLESFAGAIADRGWAVTPPVLHDVVVARLRTVVAPLVTDGRGGARNLLDLPEIEALARSVHIRPLAIAVLGADCFAVRALLFDKTPDANWKVIWHQDLSIATTARADVAGYGPWTEKAGVPHVQPPASVLANMLAIRVHLDPCGVANGPVRVLDRSHRLGRLSSDAISTLRQNQPEIDCVVEQGGILSFRPLTLHASAPSTVPSHRRVIHIEFAAGELAPPLDWHRRVAAGGGRLTVTS